jgi:hypothetical protein
MAFQSFQSLGSQEVCLIGEVIVLSPLSFVNPGGKRVVGQFAVAALYERRNLLNQKPAVIDRRYKKPK